MARILVIDDEETIRRLLKASFERKNHEVFLAEDGFKACEAFPKFQPDVIMSDVKMPKMDGFQTIERLKAENKVIPPFIFITGHGEKSVAIESLRKGAFDYVEKPFEMDEIFFIIDRAIEKHHMQGENSRLSDDLKIANQKLAERLEARTELVRRIQHPALPTNKGTTHALGMLGNSPAIAPVRAAIERLSKSELGSNMSVLITGPSGSGKEIIARMLHDLSKRTDGPWVPLNCAAFPENLIEAELFGYEKGAFTGANNRKPGVFEMADGGTLFLDEIGELPINLQAKLLRALQEQCFRRIGGTQEIKVNVRVIAATNKDLKKAVENKTFRDDLFYRLNTLPIQIPSLKERGNAETLRLAKLFLEETASSTQCGASTFSPEAEKMLTSHNWPGNIRELKSVVQRAALLCDGTSIDAHSMQAAIGNHPVMPLSFTPAGGAGMADASDGGSSAPLALASGFASISSAPSEQMQGMSYHDWKRSIVMRMERQYLEQQLEHFHGNVSAMSRSMKVTRPNLCRLLKKHGLNAEDFREHPNKAALAA